MGSADYTAKQIAEILQTLISRLPRQCSDRELDAVVEAVRRLKEHEILIADVLPDLRRRLDAAEQR